MGRTDRVGRVINAPRSRVYQALVDRESLQTWLPPNGMRGEITHFDPRPGGGYRLVLTYLDLTDSPGKSSDESDIVDIEFADLVADERVVCRNVFESEDPAFAGTMTMTWQLTDSDSGTKVDVVAENVPPGISPEAHETGIGSSLANLAAYVEG